MLNTIGFQIAFGAVKHFGKNLYTSNPPALAELIANAWDAYATKCEIYEKNGSLIITDDGIGMNDTEFESIYAKSGLSKDIVNIRVPNNQKNRPYMGKKGIGKFAAFSLGDLYILYTKSVEDDMWKKIELDNTRICLNQAIINVPVRYISKEQFEKEINDYGIPFSSNESGTVIVIPNLKRKFIRSTTDSLIKLMARRFSTNLLCDFTFTLSINGEDVNLKSHYYYDSVEFVCYFGYKIDDVKRKFPFVERDDFFIDGNNKFFDDNNVRGWIGSVNKPADLKVDNEVGMSGITVYINGKLAEENLLKFSHNATIASSYFVGEIDAEFLQNTDDDPILSSREGLNYELDTVQELQKNVNEVRTKLISIWDELRSKRTIDKQCYLKKILKNEKYNLLYQNLKDDEKSRFDKYSQRLFDGKQEDEMLIDFYTPVIFSVVNTESLNKIGINNNDSVAEILVKFAELFDKIEVNTALHLKANLQNRLSVIDKLERIISEDAVESVFEEHLKKNPWLINPYWDYDKNKIISQQTYTRIGIDNNIEKGRLDLLVPIAESKFPVIVELKREKATAYSTPDVSAIVSQIYKYRRAIIGIYEPTEIEAKKVNAIYICGNKAHEKLEAIDYEELKSNAIDVLTYQNIIDHARGLYHKAIDAIDSIDD